MAAPLFNNPSFNEASSNDQRQIIRSSNNVKTFSRRTSQSEMTTPSFNETSFNGQSQTIRSSNNVERVSQGKSQLGMTIASLYRPSFNGTSFNDQSQTLQPVVHAKEENQALNTQNSVSQVSEQFEKV
ncbi:unnamed protein product [Rotaria sp. Silwood2]|nr:unnamed protein product [Rotaria sp. Silwood2]CAF4213492.1 unnamed protein product [Rotaria sp. Silwood2]